MGEWLITAVVDKVRVFGCQHTNQQPFLGGIMEYRRTVKWNELRYSNVAMMENPL